MHDSRMMQDLALDLSIIKLEIIVKITHLGSEKQIENVADKILKRCIHALSFYRNFIVFCGGPQSLKSRRRIMTEEIA